MRITDVLCATVLGASAAAGLGCGASSGGAAAGHRGDDPNRCATCHMPDYLATKKPMHPGAKPTTCGVCHASTSWHPSHLDHPFWALTGAHEKADCFDCHRGTPPAFKGTSKVCVDCHRPDYDGSKFPGHSTFPLTCAECHTTTAWKPSTSPAPPTANGAPAPNATPPAAPSPGDLPRKNEAPNPQPKPKPAPTATAPDVVTKPSRRGER